jgi:hypothetical protein
MAAGAKRGPDIGAALAILLPVVFQHLIAGPGYLGTILL